MMEHDQPLVEFKDVCFSYNSRPVLENISFSINKNELTYIVGPNGGGKTTLLKLTLGLLKPNTGEISVYNQSNPNGHVDIGYAPQQVLFDPSFPVSAIDVVLMGRLNREFQWRYSKTDRSIAVNSMDRVGMADLQERSFSALSGGERQRLLIARALACEPELLLLDEPTANIDLEAENKLNDIVFSLSKEMTIMMVSHDFGFVSESVTNVLCINQSVSIHPTTEITPEAIRTIYEGNIRMIRHDIHPHNH